MSSAEPPLLSALDGQRRALELTHRAASMGVDLQRRAVRSFVDSLEAQRAASKSTTAFVDSVLETSMLATKASVPRGSAAFEDVEYRFEEQLEAFDELQEASWTLVSDSMGDGLSAYERMADVYADALDASFEAAIEGTDWMADEVAGSVGRRERAVEVEVEAGEP